MTLINHCPFCGNTDVKARTRTLGSVDTGQKPWFFAYCHCQHCNAKGPHYRVTDSDREEALEQCIHQWNAATPRLRDEILRRIRYWLSGYIPHNWIPF